MADILKSIKVGKNSYKRVKSCKMAVIDDDIFLHPTSKGTLDSIFDVSFS